MVYRSGKYTDLLLQFPEKGMESELWIGKLQNKNLVFLYMRGLACRLKDKVFSLGTTAHDRLSWLFFFFSPLEEKGMMKVYNKYIVCSLSPHLPGRAFSSDCKGPESLLRKNHILGTDELRNSIMYIWEAMILNQILTTTLLNKN